MELTIDVNALRPLGQTLLAVGGSTLIAWWLDRRNRKRADEDLQRMLGNFALVNERRLQTLDQGIAANIRVGGEAMARSEELEGQVQILAEQLQATTAQVVQNAENLSSVARVTNSNTASTDSLSQALEMLRSQAPLQEEFMRRREAAQ